MAALGWLLNLDFAGGGVPATDRFVTRLIGIEVEGSSRLQLAVEPSSAMIVGVEAVSRVVSIQVGPSSRLVRALFERSSRMKDFQVEP